MNQLVPRSLEVRTGDYITYAAAGKYPALVEYIKRDQDCANLALFGRYLLVYVRSREEHKIY